MTLKDYLFGRRIVLRSPHRRDWVIDRIRSSVHSPFGFMKHGVSGGVFFGQLRLAWDVPMFSNGFRPVFRGRLVESGRSTELQAVFGASTFLRLFFGFWYGFQLLFTSVALLMLAEGEPFGTILPMLAIVPLFLLAPPGFHFLFNRNADRHLEAMLDLLKREAGLVPVERSRLAAA